MYKGYDLSVLQGFPDFHRLVADGTSFIIHRCGVGNSSIDVNYDKNIAAAKAAGILVMAYHFIYPLLATPSQPLRDPIKQANYHWTAAKGERSAIDCEWPAPQDMNKWGVTNSSINQWMRAYFEEYTRLDSNRRPLIYTYPYWAKAISLDSYFAQYQLWIASYQPTPAVPAPWKDWTMWQRSGGTEKLPNGVPVDVNVVRDLSLWDSTPVIVSPPPEPDPIASNQSDSDNGGIELSTHQSVPTTAPSSSSSSSSSSSIFGFLDNLFKR